MFELNFLLNNPAEIAVEEPRAFEYSTERRRPALKASNENLQFREYST